MRASGVRTHLPGRGPEGPLPGRTSVDRVRARSSSGPDGPDLRGGGAVQLPPCRSTRRWAPRALARPTSRSTVRLHDPAASGRAILVAVTAASGSQWCASRRCHSVSPRPPRELRTVISIPWPRVGDGRGPEGPSTSAFRGCPPSGDLAGCRSSVPTRSRHSTDARSNCPEARGKTQDVHQVSSGCPQKATDARTVHASRARRLRCRRDPGSGSGSAHPVEVRRSAAHRSPGSSTYWRTSGVRSTSPASR
jgi:hypothetical protein